MGYNKKSICIGIIKAIVFLLIFLILFHSATDLFRTKSGFYAISPIYDLPQNSVDVLLLGTSHMNNAISPMDLWYDYGITSFNAGFNSQTVPTSYFIMRELLKVQKPKVVVLETYFIFQKEPIRDNEEMFHLFVDNIPLSSGVSEAIQTLIQEDHDKTEYYLNFYSFHNRWKELSKEDFKLSLNYNRGASKVRYNQHSTMENLTIVSRSETETPPELPLEYLHKIIDLCRENKIPLVLMVQPCNIDSDRQKMINYVDVVAKEEGVPYLNFFYLLEETGFDFSKDMAEWSHINYSGVQKITSYLGEYLQTNYQLEDHRSDPKITDLWNKDYETFAQELNNTMMKTAENLEEYFAYLQNQDYILAWNAYSKTALSNTALPTYLETMGIDRSGIKNRKYYCAVTRGNQLLYKKSLEEKQDDTYMVEDALFSFGSGITGSSNDIGVHVGRKEYSVGKTGVNLVVYDPVSRMVVDNVNIDLSTGEIKR